MNSFGTVVDRLRAVAEPSRLRLLAILARGEFSVTELTQALGQSQPRVSRHLKLLCDAGLLEKFREQHWVYYRVPASGPGREWVDDLLARIDTGDRTLAADAARVESVLEQRGASAGHEPAQGSSRAAELASALAAELGERGRGALFYFGPSPTDVLGVIAPRAGRAIGMHGARMEVQRARATLHSRGLSHCVLQQGELRNLPQPSAEFDVVIVDRSLAGEARPVEALHEAARLLRPEGTLIVVEDYEAIARASDASANPLQTLRAWTASAGLVCSRLHPIDVDGAHLLLGIAHAAVTGKATQPVAA